MLSVLGIGAPVISFIFLLFLMFFFVFLVRVIITIGAATALSLYIKAYVWTQFLPHFVIANIVRFSDI